MNANHLTNNVVLAPNCPAAADTPFWIEAAGQGTCPVCASPGPHDLLSDSVLPGPRNALSLSHRQMLFAELVNRGDMARAAVHHGLVAEAAAAWEETARGIDAVGHRDRPGLDLAALTPE